MTMDETRQEPLDEQACLVVAALADGEQVDADALRSALGQPAVRDYLVDLIALRQTVVSVTPKDAVRWRERQSVWSRQAWFTAAAAVVFSLAAGYVAGQRTSVQTPPSSAMETIVDVGSTSMAPKPTRVVTLRPGVNWIEKAGEQ
jgi:hypothetical protein